MKSRQPDDVPIFFDLDGTLADSAGGIVASLDHALAVCCVRDSLINWRRYIGPPLPWMLASALPDLSPNQRDEIVSAYRAYYDTAGMFMTTLFPGVAEVISELAARGMAEYVVTNKPQEAAEAIVHHLKLDGFFSRVVGGDPTGKATKPDRAAQLVAEEGISGGFFIGDGLDDLFAAERIGATFLLAGWGYGTSRVLAERRDVTLVRRPSDLLPLLFGQRAFGQRL